MELRLSLKHFVTFSDLPAKSLHYLRCVLKMGSRNKWIRRNCLFSFPRIFQGLLSFERMWSFKACLQNMEISKNVHLEMLTYFVLAFLIEIKHCIPGTEVVHFLLFVSWSACRHIVLPLLPGLQFSLWCWEILLPGWSDWNTYIYIRRSWPTWLNHLL